MKKKIIIDCDPGIDDALALMLACKSEELEILGVTVTAGNVDTTQGVQNALDILHLLGRDDIPVAIGATKPLERDPDFAYDTHGENGLGNVELEHARREPLPDAVELMRDLLEKGEDITLVSIGPLTNIAKLLQKYPESAKKIKELVMMGGTYQEEGNCSLVAEFNVWFDPEAAQFVFENLGRKITMVGLDVTRKIVFTPNYQALVNYFDSDLARPVYDIVQFYNDFHWDQEGTLGSVINDPLAISYLIDPTLCNGIYAEVDVLTQDKARGMTYVSDQLTKGINCYVLTEVDAKRFFSFFLKRLFPDYQSSIDYILEDNTYGKPAEKSH